MGQVVEQGAVGADGDLGAVGEVQPPHAARRPAGGQHDAQAAPAGGTQRRPRPRRDGAVGLQQGTVEVGRYESDRGHDGEAYSTTRALSCDGDAGGSAPPHGDADALRPSARADGRVWSKRERQKGRPENEGRGGGR